MGKKKQKTVPKHRTRKYSNVQIKEMKLVGRNFLVNQRMKDNKEGTK